MQTSALKEQRMDVHGEVVERRFHDRRVAPSMSEMQIVGIRAAITSFYLDRDAGQYGPASRDFALSKIERILGMHWEEHKARLHVATLPDMKD